MRSFRSGTPPVMTHKKHERNVCETEAHQCAPLQRRDVSQYLRDRQAQQAVLQARPVAYVFRSSGCLPYFRPSSLKSLPLTASIALRSSGIARIQLLTETLFYLSYLSSVSRSKFSCRWLWIGFGHSEGVVSKGSGHLGSRSAGDVACGRVQGCEMVDERFLGNEECCIHSPISFDIYAPRRKQ